MADEITTKTRGEVEDLVKAVITGQIPDADVAEGSDYDLTAKMLAAVFMGNQSAALTLSRQVIGDEAVGEFLARHLKSRGITSPKATYSTGLVLLTADTAGRSQPAGSILTAPDGTQYETLAAAVSITPTLSGSPVVVDPANRERIVVRPNANSFSVNDPITINSVTRAVRDVGPQTGGKVWIDMHEPFPTDPSGAISAATGVVVAIKSKETGLATMKERGTVLTLESPATGFDATGRVQILSGGRDDANEAEQQGLIAAYNSQRPQIGLAQFYRELALKTPDWGFADAIVFPNYRGLGAHDIELIGTLRRERRVGPQAVAAVQAFIDAFGYPDDILVKSILLPNAEDVTVTVEPAVGFEPDFAPTSFTVNTGSSDASTGLLVFSSGNPITAGVEIGDRVCFSITDVKPKFQHLAVKARTTTSITLESPIATLTGITAVRPGGPLVDAIVEAIEDLFDSFGPSSIRTSTGTRHRRHPAPTELWYEKLSVAELSARMLAVDGCKNVAVSAPAADVVGNPGETLDLGDIAIIHDLTL